MDFRELSTELYNISKRQKIDNSEILLELSAELKQSNTLDSYYQFLVKFLPESYSLPWNVVHKFAKVSKAAIPAFAELKKMDDYWKRRVDEEYPDYAKFAVNVPDYIESFRKRMPAPADVSGWYLIYQAGRKRDFNILTRNYKLEDIIVEDTSKIRHLADYVVSFDAGTYHVDTGETMISFRNTERFIEHHNYTKSYVFHDGVVLRTGETIVVYPSSLLDSYDVTFKEWLKEIQVSADFLDLSDEFRYALSANPRRIVSCRDFIRWAYRMFNEEVNGIHDFGSELIIPKNSEYNCSVDGYFYKNNNGAVYASDYDSNSPRFLAKVDNEKYLRDFCLFKYGSQFGIIVQPTYHEGNIYVYLAGQRFVVGKAIAKKSSARPSQNGWFPIRAEDNLMHLINLRAFIENRPIYAVEIPWHSDVSINGDVAFFVSRLDPQHRKISILNFDNQVLLAAQCVHCNEPAEVKCKKCDTPYCDDICQTLHWKEHKLTCNKAQ